METNASLLKLVCLCTLFCFFHGGYMLQAQNITKVEYFIDTDPGFDHATSVAITPGENIPDLSFNIPMNSVPSGFHHLFIRAKDANGKWSITQVRNFYKESLLPALPNIVKAEYFLDTDPGFGAGTAIEINPAKDTQLSFVVNLANLPNGFHTLYVRALDANGKWTLTNHRNFFKEGLHGASPNIVKAEYFLDTDPGFGSGKPIDIASASAEADLTFAFNLDTVKTGFHTLYVRTQDVNGRWSLTNVRNFFKEDIKSALSAIVKAEYFIDTDPGFNAGTSIPLTPGNTITNLPLAIDLSSVSLGNHMLYVRVQDANGKWSLTHQQMFRNSAANFKYQVVGSNAFYTNLSKEADSFTWIFGDSQTNSSHINPKHTFQTPGVYNTCLVVTGSFGADTLCQSVGIRGIQSVQPATAASTGLAITQVFGFGFGPGAVAKLVKDGQAVSIAEKTFVIDTTQLRANFRLKNAVPGTYDVVVSHPSQPDDTLRNAFTIQSNTQFDPWTKIEGPARVLVNRPTSFRVAYGNKGTTTEFGVPLYIRVEGDVQVSLLNEMYEGDVPQEILDAVPSSRFYTITDSITGKSYQLGAFIIPYIQPGITQFAEIKVKSNNLAPFSIKAHFGSPLFDNQQVEAAGLRVNNSCTFLPGCLQCALDLAGFIPAVGCVTGGFSLGCSIGNLVNDLAQGGTPQGKALYLDMLSNIAGTFLSCVPGAKLAASMETAKDLGDFISTANGAASCGESCSLKPKDPQNPNNPDDTQDSKDVSTVSSFDPNIKEGPAGSTEQHYIFGNTPLSYKISFENLSAATAPASEVFITDQLDTTLLDLNTLVFTGFGFGDSTYSLAAQRDFFATDLDLRPAKNTILRITGELDKQTGVVSWKFSSFDPKTMELTEDVMAGFLPPNQNKPEGEGFVTFSIRAKPNLPHLQAISNEADIIFDANAVIKTPVWTNRLDRQQPESAILPQIQLVNDSSFVVRWSGVDAQAGISQYSIYVSEEDGDYTLWQVTDKDSALFVAKPGKKYAFYSIARDKAGNMESAPGSPDARIDAVTGLAEDFARLIQVYPNPAREFVTISAPAGFHIQTLRMLTIQGQQVSVRPVTEKDQLILSVSHLPRGVYILQLQSGKYIVNKKLIIQ